MLLRKGRGCRRVGCLRSRDVRAKPRAVHGRRLLRLWGRLLICMRLIRRRLGHRWCEVGLTQ